MKAFHLKVDLCKGKWFVKWRNAPVFLSHETVLNTHCFTRAANAAHWHKQSILFTAHGLSTPIGHICQWWYHGKPSSNWSIWVKTINFIFKVSILWIVLYYIWVINIMDSTILSIIYYLWMDYGIVNQMVTPLALAKCLAKAMSSFTNPKAPVCFRPWTWTSYRSVDQLLTWQS